MKSELQKLDGLKRCLRVEVPSDTVTTALEKRYKEMQRIAKFKGFRPGKAPMNLVRSNYKGQVESDVASQIIKEHYGMAVDEHQLFPINFPEFQFDGFKEGEPLKFSATFEIRPEVDPKKYVGFEIKSEKLEITDETINRILENMQKEKASLVPLIELRAAQMGDVAIIDFHGHVDGSPLPGGEGKEFMLELGSKQFIEGFEEGVVGMNPGDTKTLDLKFPDNYSKAELSGKPVSSAVSLKEIKKKAFPPLDDAFAKMMGDHSSLDDLKNSVRKEVEASEKIRIKDDVKKTLLNELVAANPFDCPASMIGEHKKAIIEDLHRKMEHEQGMTHEQFEEYVKKWDNDLEDSATFFVRSSLLVNAVARKESLFPSDSEIDEKISGYAQKSGIELEKLKGFYSKSENKSRLRFQMTEDKVIDFILEKSKITEEEKTSK